MAKQPRSLLIQTATTSSPFSTVVHRPWQLELSKRKWCWQYPHLPVAVALPALIVIVQVINVCFDLACPWPLPVHKWPNDLETTRLDAKIWDGRMSQVAVAIIPVVMFHVQKPVRHLGQPPYHGRRPAPVWPFNNLLPRLECRYYLPARRYRWNII